MYLCDLSCVAFVCFEALLPFKIGRLKTNVSDLEHGNNKRV